MTDMSAMADMKARLEHPCPATEQQDKQQSLTVAVIEKLHEWSENEWEFSKKYLLLKARILVAGKAVASSMPNPSLSCRGSEAIAAAARARCR